mmetsp:Transcript_70387/g.139623  ORF Transcript_70387/g.139623 Transcript_70387/m.139623 type:complete len:775 (-) Transcript_70387:153-2477(-)
MLVAHQASSKQHQEPEANNNHGSANQSLEQSVCRHGTAKPHFHEGTRFFTVGEEHEEDSEDQSTECGKRLMFSRDHPVVTAWSAILFIMLSYLGTLFLYRFCFLDLHASDVGIRPIGEADFGWKVWDIIVDVFFWFDLVFNFLLAQENPKGAEIFNLWYGAKRYLKFMFWLNLLACLPEEIFRLVLEVVIKDGSTSQSADPGAARIVRLQRISRMARLARLTRLATRLAKLVEFHNKFNGLEWFGSLRGVRVAKFLLGLVWTSHLLACGWYLTAVLHEPVHVTWLGRRMVEVQGEQRSLLQQGPFEQWVVAMYFVLTVFTTVGFGDISAGTEAEIFFVVIIMLVGAVVHSIIISEVINTLTSTDKAAESINRQMKLLDAFCIHADLDPEMRRRIRTEIFDCSKNWAEKTSFDKEEMRALLLGKLFPRSIIGKLPDVLYRGKLRNNMFLQCCSEVSIVPPRLPCLLAVHLIPAEFMSGEVVFQLHDFAYNLGLVLCGTFAFVGQPSHAGGVDAMPSNSMEEEDNAGLCRQPSSGLHKFPSNIPPWQLVLSQGPVVLSHRSRPHEQAHEMKAALNTEHSGTEAKAQNLSPYRLLGPKTYFGDMECITGSMRPATLRCERSGTTLLLRKNDFFELLEEFPHFGQVWASVAWRRDAHRRNALKRLTAPQSCRSLAATTIQLAFRSKRWSPDPSPGGLRCATVLRQATAKGRSAPESFVKSKQYNHRDLTEMTAPAPSNSYVLREVEKLQHAVGGIQSEMTHMKDMLQLLVSGGRTTQV